MHAMVYHVPSFMRMHNGIKKFTGQGRESVIHYDSVMCITSPIPHSLTLHAYESPLFPYVPTGTEKNNDDCRRIHLNKSNKWDAATDVLLVMKRIEALSGHQRTPRAYEKRNNNYWQQELKDRREQCKRRRMQNDSSCSEIDHGDHINVANMSLSELQEGLKTFGIKTRVRNLKRLQEMYEDALANQ